MKGRILQFLSDLLLIANLPRDRGPLFLIYVRLSLKKPFKRSGIHSERFLGFKVTVPDYHAFFVMFREIFIEQVYYFASTTATPFIVDCGGNIGMATLYFKYLYPRARIVVYEPSPAFEFLQKNTSQLSDIEPVEKAVADHDGTVVLHFPLGTAAFMGATTNAELARSKALAPSHEVATERLAGRHREHIHVLKLDIEGSEGVIIRDLAHQNKLTMDHVLMEFHHNPAGSDLDEMLRLLRTNGYWYRLWGDRPKRFDLRPSHIAIHAYRMLPK